VEDVLSSAGLDEPLRAIGGFARAVYKQLLAIIGPLLKASQAQTSFERAIEFLEMGGKLRFSEPDAKGIMARGLLAPWLGGGVTAEPIQRHVQSTLLRHLGDPRIQKSQWLHAGDDAATIMRGWLARASLIAFFDLIAEHAPDEHFRYRRAFWTACLKNPNANDQPGIEDAWLALGRQIHTSARAVRDLNGAYARLEGGVSSNHAVLLLKIGNTVFCEWSHNGKLRAWPIDWANAPRFLSRSYSRADLTAKGLPFPTNPRFGSRGSTDGNGLIHIGSERSYWQGSVARLLEQRVGLRVSANDWTPK
jgi:EH_Signature domain